MRAEQNKRYHNTKMDPLHAPGPMQKQVIIPKLNWALRQRHYLHDHSPTLSILELWTA